MTYTVEDALREETTPEAVAAPVLQQQTPIFDISSPDEIAGDMLAAPTTPAKPVKPVMDKVEEEAEQQFLSQDDYLRGQVAKNLSYYKNEAVEGGFTLAKGVAGALTFFGVLDEETAMRDFSNERLKAMKDPVEENFTAPDLFGIFGSVTRNAPNLAALLAGGAVGAGVGGLIGSAAGTAGGPAAPATVPVLGIAFGVGGADVGVAGTAMLLNGGEHYLTARQNGVPATQARIGAAGYAVISGALTALRIKQLAEATKDGVSTFLKNEQGQYVLKASITRVIKQMGLQVAAGDIDAATRLTAQTLEGLGNPNVNSTFAKPDWKRLMWEANLENMKLALAFELGAKVSAR